MTTTDEILLFILRGGVTALTMWRLHNLNPLKASFGLYLCLLLGIGWLFLEDCLEILRFFNFHPLDQVSSRIWVNFWICLGLAYMCWRGESRCAKKKGQNHEQMDYRACERDH